MLKEMLLQMMIAFLPASMFMAWYSKPEKTRYAPLFITLACGIAMQLTMHFSYVSEFGQYFDFGKIPLLIGSLYGGIPGAILLVSVYVVTRVLQIDSQEQYIIFFSSIIVFIPVLFFRIKAFGKAGRSGRLSISMLLCGIILFSTFILTTASLSDFYFEYLFQHIGFVLFFSAVFLAILIGSVHLTEMGFERIQLQIQIRDVSHKYRNEVRRLQQFIDNTPLIVVFCDTQGTITLVNDMAIKLLAPLGRKDLIGKPFGVLTGKAEFQFDTCPIERVVEGEARVTEMLQARGRTFYTVTCQIQEMPSQGTEGVLFIGHDVTELQRLKDEVDKMERLSLVGQMAASITHEIRNPMAVIRGFMQLLNERSPEDQQSYFRIVLEELDRANAIINDFLSLAQNRIVEKESSNLHDILNDILPLVWADSNMRGQIIELKLCDHIDPLELNSKEIKQLVLNLARNGMEAMDDKGVLRIETFNNRDMVQLRVTDNGVGMSAEKLDRLFEPFYTTKTNGTGLGLALCLSIVERHNGKIQVDSTVGVGTTFTVTFCKPGRICW